MNSQFYFFIDDYDLWLPKPNGYFILHPKFLGSPLQTKVYQNIDSSVKLLSRNLEKVDSKFHNEDFVMRLKMWRDWLRKKDNQVLRSFWNVGMDDLDLDEFDDDIFYKDWVRAKIDATDAIFKRIFIDFPQTQSIFKKVWQIKTLHPGKS